MPAINLDELVPEDLSFTFRGQTYVIPGDLDVDTTFDLIALFQRFGKAETQGSEPAMRKLNKAFETKLLELFRLHDPSLERLPFGVVSYRIVLLEVLKALGMQVVEDDGGDPPSPLPAAPNRASRRSSGSPRSASTSRSARAGGKASPS